APAPTQRCFSFPTFCAKARKERKRERNRTNKDRHRPPLPLPSPVLFSRFRSFRAFAQVFFREPDGHASPTQSSRKQVRIHGTGQWVITSGALHTCTPEQRGRREHQGMSKWFCWTNDDAGSGDQWNIESV